MARRGDLHSLRWNQHRRTVYLDTLSHPWFSDIGGDFGISTWNPIAGAERRSDSLRSWRDEAFGSLD
jgi:hypothetical protein